jgi:sugar lactone lactonase YvrE
MGFRRQGGYVLATKKGFAFWDPAHPELVYLGDPDPDQGEARFNDAKTDPQGRFWAGKMSGQPENSLFRFDPDQSIHRMESGIAISNGMGWSPDQRVFYYTDSLARCIYAYDFQAQTGAIANRRIFATIPQDEGVPDGLTVDSEGFIWSARWGGWKIVRYAPDGSVEREITMPVELVTSCTFGGPDLDELYITSAWIDVKPEDRAAQPMAGDVFRLKTSVKGIAEPFFAG